MFLCCVFVVFLCVCLSVCLISGVFFFVWCVRVCVVSLLCCFLFMLLYALVLYDMFFCVVCSLCFYVFFCLCV